jgi:hypothetical protein
MPEASRPALHCVELFMNREGASHHEICVNAHVFPPEGIQKLKQNRKVEIVEGRQDPESNM